MILFCNDVLNPSAPDAAFTHEVAAATNAAATNVNFGFQLIDYEKLVAGQVASALRRVRESETPQTAIYRGWMWRVEDYTRLYHALQTKYISLINTPQQYEHCHHLPVSLSIIENHAPRTVIIPLDEMSSTRIADAARVFGDQSLIVKDYVKSRKHDWNTACFIQNAQNADEVERVCGRFIELQGENLVGGLVLREFVNFKSIGAHGQSAMPLTKEYRLFFLDGELLCRFPYWNDGDYSGEAPPDSLFCDVAQTCKVVFSRWMSRSVPTTTNGWSWNWATRKFRACRAKAMQQRFMRSYARLCKVFRNIEYSMLRPSRGSRIALLRTTILYLQGQHNGSNRTDSDRHLARRFEKWQRPDRQHQRRSQPDALHLCDAL